MPDLRARPGPLRRIGRWAVAVLGLITLVTIAPTTPATAAPAPGVARSATTAGQDDPCAAPTDFTDHQAVVDVAVTCLQATGDHTAIIGDQRYSADEFADAIDRARTHNVALSVVVLGDEVAEGEGAARDGASDIADGVLHVVGGTVVVVTPDHFGVASEQFGQSDLDAAADAVGGVGDDAEVVTKIVDSLTAKPFPWLLAVLATIVVLVLGAFAGGLWTRHRRHHADAEALADLTAGLASRVNDLAPTIVSITDEVDIAGRPDLEERFARATGDYNELRDLLGSPLPTRAAVNEAAARVQHLTQDLAAVDTEVSAALASHRPPDQPPSGRANAAPPNDPTAG